MFPLVSIAAAMFCCVAPPHLLQPVKKPEASPVRVHHIRIKGELDNARIGADAAREIQNAPSEGAEVIILEIGANSWRADVLLTIADAIAASTVPVRLLLSDPKDRRIGAGASVLGLVAPACFVDPQTTVASRPGDDRSDLAPKGVDLSLATRGLLERARVGQQARGADARLAEFLLSPSSAMWAIEPSPPPGAPMLLSPTPPRSTGAGSSAHAVGVAALAPGETVASISISAQAAAGLRLSTGEAARPGDILSAERQVARPLVARVVESGLAEAQTRLARDMKSVDDAIEATDRTLSVRVPDQRSNTAPLYHRAGREALTMATKASETLAGAERLTQEYPELLQGPAHGRTPVASADRDHARDWRAAFQERRDKLASQEVRARQHLSR